MAGLGGGRFRREGRRGRELEGWEHRGRSPEALARVRRWMWFNDCCWFAEEEEDDCLRDRYGRDGIIDDRLFLSGCMALHMEEDDNLFSSRDGWNYIYSLTTFLTYCLLHISLKVHIFFITYIPSCYSDFKGFIWLYSIYLTMHLSSLLTLFMETTLLSSHLYIPRYDAKIKINQNKPTLRSWVKCVPRADPQNITKTTKLSHTKLQVAQRSTIFFYSDTINPLVSEPKSIIFFQKFKFLFRSSQVYTYIFYIHLPNLHPVSTSSAFINHLAPPLHIIRSLSLECHLPAGWSLVARPVDLVRPKKSAQSPILSTPLACLSP